VVPPVHHFPGRSRSGAEVSIGHAITADALRLGFPAAVEAYLRAIRLPDAGF
jgi:pyridoxine 5'-phosphate synthase PdxJ